jgi:hypothetical protein
MFTIAEFRQSLSPAAAEMAEGAHAVGDAHDADLANDANQRP